MIAAFLLPFPLRGYRAPFLWVYYRLLSSFDERLLFMTSADYTRDPHEWQSQGRWEMLPRNAQRLHYQVPLRSIMAGHDYGFLGADIYEALLAESGGNPIAAYRRLLSDRVPCLEAAFAEILSSEYASHIEAVLTWCNCPSLTAVAAEKGIPVLHLEIGPLRWPLYRPTSYVDFSGVNGNTEAERRYLSSGFRPQSGVDVDALRRFFYVGGDQAAPDARFRLGVALQVEDDSNLLAFGHGFDNQSLLVYAHLQQPGGNVLVRGHPGSLFALKPDWYAVDDSRDSVGFIRRCDKLLTINSSVGLEAMLLETPVEVLGDCAHRFIGAASDARERACRMAYYLFAYLVPMEFSFDPAYLRYRLSGPSDVDIVIRHLDAYLGGAAWRDGEVGSQESLIRRALDFALSDTRGPARGSSNTADGQHTKTAE